jgi:hypothetical protein
MTKPTPGPWKIDSSVSDMFITAEVPGGRVTIATVHRDSEHGWLPRAANARYIASAPLLVATLEHVLASVTSGAEITQEMAHAIGKLAATAIEAATGEPQ